MKKEYNFEGSLILEYLAEQNQLDRFYQFVDQDRLGEIRNLLDEYGFDDQTINIVIDKLYSTAFSFQVP